MTIMKTTLSLLLLCCLAAVTLSCPRSGSSTPPTSKREKIAKKAEANIGSKVWAKAVAHKVGAGEWKCNIFVAEMIEAAGASVPHRHWYMWSPIGANEWAKTDSSYLVDSGCWTHVTSSGRGDVAAYGGHVGIVVGTDTVVSAKRDDVVKDYSYQGAFYNLPAGQNPTFWRYKC
ncbi:hypothetical protein LSAT2_012047 [Lamellibrachia satsuma]|nr:hypothetical protein LSAT2_012047 [Lamellibrachia satsuma]